MTKLFQEKTDKLDHKGVHLTKMAENQQALELWKESGGAMQLKRKEQQELGFLAGWQACEPLPVRSASKDLRQDASLKGGLKIPDRWKKQQGTSYS